MVRAGRRRISFVIDDDDLDWLHEQARRKRWNASEYLRTIIKKKRYEQ